MRGGEEERESTTTTLVLVKEEKDFDVTRQDALKRKKERGKKRRFHSYFSIGKEEKGPLEFLTRKRGR